LYVCPFCVKLNSQEMLPGKPTSVPSGDALWTRDLREIPTVYGRLVYLSGLINPDTGRYENYGLSPTYEPLEAHRAFKRLHEAIFKEWVAYELKRKKADIELYIAGIEQIGPAELIDAWLRLTPYKNLVPGSIQGPERQKHISDFEAILCLLKNVYGVASPDRGA
jgi:hypothetical protein